MHHLVDGDRAGFHFVEDRIALVALHQDVDGAIRSLPCTASSRVGTRTRAVGLPGSAGGVRSSSGSPNASVLPEPVFALPHTSRPARASGIVSDWIGKGWVMPAVLSDSTTSGDRP